MRFHKFIGSAILTLALAAPSILVAAPHPQDERTHDRESQNQKRVYDSKHKDYHNWDNNEDQQWRQYQSTEHLKYRDYSRANKKDQSNYWNWRHRQEEHHDDNDHHDRR